MYPIVETLSSSSSFWLTRLFFQRGLAFIYFIGFLIVLNQFVALAGRHGLSPAHLYIKQTEFWDTPSLFWFHCSDTAIKVCAWLGLLLSVFALSGYSESFGYAVSILTWALLWLLYLSFVNVGQEFYGFGWEMLLLELGFLSIFLGPKNAAPPEILIWLLRWVLFRMMFGAGMIKLRGDVCWRDLTCMIYHYETQPVPNPLSWYFHRFPIWIHKAAVLFNHFIELIVPFGFFAGFGSFRSICCWAGGLTILFQFILILSGNLSWLNYITIVLCIPCFDDQFFSWLTGMKIPTTTPLPIPMKIAVGLYAIAVLLLSLKPAKNLFSDRQMMNASFDPLHLVNTYGAFGSVTHERDEIILEGTLDENPSEQSEWKAFEFRAKPGDPKRMPTLMSPYHYHLDWQMWFAAMSNYSNHPWILNLISKLLEGNREVSGLLAHNPFAEKPPKFIRATLYRYTFAEPGSPYWWNRTKVDDYLPPLSLNSPQYRALLERMGWLQ